MKWRILSASLQAGRLRFGRGVHPCPYHYQNLFQHLHPSRCDFVAAVASHRHPTLHLPAQVIS